jgi:hypothetical protein
MFLPITTHLLAPYETHARKIKYRRPHQNQLTSKQHAFGILGTSIEHNRLEIKYF